MNNRSLAAFVVCFAGTASGQSISSLVTATFHIDHQGIGGDVMLTEVRLPDGMYYDQFIHAASIDEFYFAGGSGKLRVIAGVDTTDTEGSFKLEDLDGNSSSVSQDDLALFNDRALSAFQNDNLNNYVDISGNYEFSCVVTFSRTVRDNDPAPDATPEILYFERGSGGSNSWLVIEALDEHGNVMGTPRVMAPSEAVASDPPAMVDTHDSSLQPRNSPQEMTAVPVDLSELGVEQLDRLRMRTPVNGVDMWNGSPWTGGEIAPDFKLMVVQTYDVVTPSFLIGD
ncbi:MAG: hypothetical protein AAGB51_03325 [Planctomycetota bacterium]